MTTRIQRSASRSLLLCVAAALLLGWPAAGRTPESRRPVRARLGREFTLRVGQQATVEGLRVRFASVAGDSRCPAGVTCVWAGNAEVLVEAESGSARAVLKLNTHGGANFPKEAQHGRYSVGLVALSPSPRASGRIKAEDYVATLVIRKT